MPIIELNTFINANPEICFDLSLHIDLHVQSMEETNEKAISGRTDGQINFGESVRWNARHFGIYFTMTIRISELVRPLNFTDEMIEGPFKYLRHKHVFEKTNGGTMMTDLFDFESPLGILGRTVDKTFLTVYMRRLLVKRNGLIKATAERKKDISI